MKKMTGTEFVEVTPELASEWLTLNSCNRCIKKAVVNMYAASMERGAWGITGETIKFGSNGLLLDGQHRLSAVIKSGATVILEVRYGLDPAGFINLDSGSKRTSADVFGIKGVPNAHNAAAATRMIMGVKSYDLKTLTSELIYDFYLENAGLVDLVKDTSPFYRASGHLISHSRLSAYYFLMSERDSEAAQSFMEKFSYGVGLEAGCPTLHLRNALIKFRLLNNSNISKKGEHGHVAKAWNYYLKGKKIKQLRFPRSEDPMDF